MTPLIALGMLGGSALTGAIAGRDRKQVENSTSTSEQVLTPEQQAALQQLFASYGGMVGDPGKYLTPIKSGLMAGVNNSYTAGMEQLSEQDARFGIRPDSGAAAAKRVSMMRERMRGMGSVEEYIAKMMMDQRDQGMRGLTQLATHSFGEKRTSSGTSTMKGPGMLAGAAQGAAEMGGYMAGRKYFK